jgi:branched-chain amino acid transport system substrate-binding protein
VNQRLLDSLPAEVTNGTVTWAPSPDVESPAFRRLQTLLGTDDPDPYSCQTNDHASLACLAAAIAPSVTGEGLRTSVRTVSQGGGERVTDVLDGLRLLREGKKIDYTGASGPCDFTDNGDILTCPFRYEIAEGAKLRTLRIS